MMTITLSLLPTPFRPLQFDQEHVLSLLALRLLSHLGIEDDGRFSPSLVTQIKGNTGL
jgi:hypothetical protein